MCFPPVYYQIVEEVSERLPHLRSSQHRGLALWVFGLWLAHRGTETAVAVTLSAWGVSFETARQRLREWLYDGADKAAPCRTQIEVETCFAPLFAWILAAWQGSEVPLAVDATLQGDRLVALVVSVLYRGSAIPLAWKILPAGQKGAWLDPLAELLLALAPALPPDRVVSVLADRGLWSPKLWRAIQQAGMHPLLRVQKTILFQPEGGKKGPAARLIEGVGHAWVGRGKAFKDHRLDATLIVLWLREAQEPCLVLTDLAPEVAPLGGYGLRFWIELGFRCLKSAGWDWEKTQRTDSHRVARHWLAMAVATAWVTLVGSDQEDAETLSVREAKPTRRRISLFRRGLARLQRQLCEGRLSLQASWIPEPWPDLSSRIQTHYHLPNLC